jgi:membrane protein YdbS with pleckstrin-like domain
VSDTSSATYREVLWEGKPWIFPSALAQTIIVIILSVLFFWLELYFDIAYKTIVNVQAIVWTSLALFLIWIISLGNLLLLKASHKYALRGDSLEIKTGIASLNQFVIVPSGFSDLEVTQSLLERALGYGSIIIHSQSETDSDRRMVKVRSPSRVAEQIRYVMARPIVRTEQPQPSEQPK